METLSLIYFPRDNTIVSLEGTLKRAERISLNHYIDSATLRPRMRAFDGPAVGIGSIEGLRLG